MGFYGNITNTAKTTFSFDHIYTTRVDMDTYANTDGVFLGRYVLVDYDEEPIKAYFNPEDSYFYNTANFNIATKIKITPKNQNLVFQDLHNALSGVSFYQYNTSLGKFEPIQQITSYAKYFETDIKNYGRGYDSTVWVKRYDTVTSTYKYVMIAELNAVVPTFHMIVNQPNQIPVTPYFDRDTTNMDYYLHMQSDFGTRVKKAENGVKSDEKMDRIMASWKTDATGKQIYEEQLEKDVQADIYYNNDGFDFKTRHESVDTVEATYNDDTGERIEREKIDYSKNAIGYKYNISGRLYGNDADEGVYTSGYKAKDIYDWYVRLPGIGNSICKMWDKVFGNPGNNNKRYINKALYRNDELSNLVTYDKTTLMGMINTTQDLLGYYFIPIGTDGHIADKVIKNSALTVKVILNHDETNVDGVVTKTTRNYPALQCLFYSVANKKYYHYTYDPIYTLISNPKATTEVCYRKLNNKYVIANKETYKAKDANNNDLTFEEYYTREDAWKLVELSAEIDDTIYGLIAEIHNLLGTNADDVRNIETVKGSINVIRDIISNIDTNLAPGKLLHTNDQGVIETTNTYYPSSDVDATRVLVGKNPDHPWENRVRAIEVQSGSTSATAWGTSSGTIDTNENNNNTVAFKAGNKWIGLAVNPDTQLVTIRHMSSAQEHHDFATDVFIDNDIDGSATSTTDCKITLPLVKTDNAGHVIGYSTKDIYIPYNYRNISLNEQSQAEDNITVSHGTQSADSTTDTFTFATGNRWIDAKIDEDSITHSHRLVPADTLKNNVVLNGNRRTSAEQIQDVFRYGLPQDKTIATLDEVNTNEAANTFNIPYIEVDKAGHVVAAETHTVEIPDNYTTITVGSASTSTGTGTTTGTEGATSDSLAGAATLTAETLTEAIAFNPSNKWIRLKGTNTKGQDTITIGHEVHNIIATTSSEDLDLVTDATNDTRTQRATFETQTIRWDNAGHITGHDTKTWTLPDAFHNIVIGGESTETGNATAGSGTLIADTTFDSFSITPSNKWIRLYGNPVNDSIVVGHLVQDIPTTAPITDLNTSGTFNTEEYTYDEAGHIRSKAVRTLTLPYNYKTFAVAQSANETAITTNTSSIIAQNQADTMKFVAGNKWIQLAASDANTSGNDTITVAHSLQGTAGSYTGTDLAFTEFGGAVTIYGYETDNAGHIISNPTYTLTLPKGSYSNSASNKLANVITGMEFNEKTGAITTTSENVGTLVLTGYTKLNTTAIAAITANNTINEAFAALDNRIETEEEARDNAITNLRMFKTISIGGTALEADSNADTLSITAGNNGIVLTPTASTDSFTISHKAGHEVTNGFYKFSTDAYGHISATTAITLDDLTGLGAATAENLNAHVKTVTGNPHKVTAEDVGLKNVTNESKATMFTNPIFTGIPEAPTAAANTNTTQIATTAFVADAVKTANDKVAWAANYTDFNALYAAVKQKLEEEYTLVPKEKEEEEIPTA